MDIDRLVVPLGQSKQYVETAYQLEKTGGFDGEVGREVEGRRNADGDRERGGSGVGMRVRGATIDDRLPEVERRSGGRITDHRQRAVDAVRGRRAACRRGRRVPRIEVARSV
jgi:hypothetical protein